MSPTNLCRLCVNICDEGKRLYDENGQRTELYKIIFEYFHPRILNLHEAKHLTDICCQCWRHICAFHSFQTSIQVAQLKLIEELKVFVDCSKETECASPFERGSNDHLAIKDEDEFISVPEEERIAAGNSSECRSSETCGISPGKESDPRSEGGSSLTEDSKVPAVVVIGYDARSTATEEGNNPSKSYAQYVVEQDVARDRFYGFLAPAQNDSDFNAKDELAFPVALSKSYISRGSESIPQIEDTAGPEEESTEPTVLATSDVAKGAYPQVGDNSSKSNYKYVAEQGIVSRDVSDFSSADEMPLSKFVEQTPVSVTRSAEPGNKNANQNLDDLIEKWLPSIKCVVCPESWAKYSLYRQHFRQEHPHKEFYISCCKRKFSIQSRIEEHIRFHNDPNAFKCQLCGVCTTTKLGVNYHMANYHPETQDKKFACQKCGKAFTTKRGLSFHYSTNHTRLRRPKRVTQADGSSVYACKECEYTTQTYHSFSHHRWFTHNRNPSFKCTICGSSFTLASLLRKHMALHTGQVAYPCSYCPQGFKRYSNLKQHEKKKHAPGTENAKGSTGPMEVGNDPDRKATRKTKPQTQKQQLNNLIVKWLPNVECVKCSESYPYLSSLQEHFRQQHSNEKFYISCCDLKLSRIRFIKEHFQQHSDPDIFKCQLCGKCHKFKHLLESHMTREHSEACKECSHSFPTKKTLRLHYTAVHRDSSRRRRRRPQADGLQMYPCTECGRVFKQLSALRRHRSHHHLKAKYKCTICAKAFKFAGTLRFHVASSHKLRAKYKCTICGKRFKISQNLTKHAATHKLKGIYNCPACPMSFINSSNFDLHRQMAHTPAGEDPKTNSQSNEVTDLSQNPNSSNSSSFKLHLVMSDPPDIEDQKTSSDATEVADISQKRSKPVGIHKEKRSFHTCSTCSTNFNSLSNLDLHCKLAHPPAIKDLKTHSESNEVTNLSQNPSSSKHLEIAHPLATEDQKTNSESSEVFRISKKRCKHVDTHKEEKPSCNTNEDANISMKRGKHVTNERKDNYACPSCPLSFINRSNLKLHRKMEHQTDWNTNNVASLSKKPSKHVDKSKRKGFYACPSCPMSFINRSNFELHRKMAHPLDIDEQRANTDTPEAMNSEEKLNLALVVENP